MLLPRNRVRLSVTIPGKPRPCPRPRVTRYGNTYMAEDYVQWKNEAITLIRQANIAQNGNRPIVGAVECTLRFWGYRASSDADNLAKSVLDAAQVAGVFPNDRFVVHLDVWKMPNEGMAKTELEIRTL